jgi:hypothetical protein
MLLASNFAFLKVYDAQLAQLGALSAETGRKSKWPT